MIENNEKHFICSCMISQEILNCRSGKNRNYFLFLSKVPECLNLEAYPGNSLLKTKCDIYVHLSITVSECFFEFRFVVMTKLCHQSIISTDFISFLKEKKKLQKLQKINREISNPTLTRIKSRCLRVCRHTSSEYSLTFTLSSIFHTWLLNIMSYIYDSMRYIC